LEGRCLQRLEASETPLGAASDFASSPIGPATISAESRIQEVQQPKQSAGKQLEAGA